MGVLAFSFSLPGTALALEGFGPWSSTGLRGVLAAVLAIVALGATRSKLPSGDQWAPLAVVALGCGLGFPLLTALALETSSTAHSAVVIGALPMATAVISTLRTRRYPSLLFWVAGGAGAVIVIAFALAQNHGLPTLGDLFLFGALILCAAGYAEGGSLSARMPGWKVIAWGVVLSLPVNLLVVAVALPQEPIHFSGRAIFGLLYIAAISQFGGFAVWYKGMSMIGVSKASQIQLAQPLLTLIWAALFLGEHFTLAVPLTAVLVLACIVVTQRTKDA